MPPGPPRRCSRCPMVLAARSRLPGDRQSPLPAHRTDKAKRGDTVILEAVVLDAELRLRPQLGRLRPLKVLPIKKFPASRQNHH
jgi:hypothetical protein